MVMFTRGLLFLALIISYCSSFFYFPLWWTLACNHCTPHGSSCSDCRDQIKHLHRIFLASSFLEQVGISSSWLHLKGGVVLGLGGLICYSGGVWWKRRSLVAFWPFVRPHVNSFFGAWNRIFLKTGLIVETFENTTLTSPCGQAKTELFENDDNTAPTLFNHLYSLWRLSCNLQSLHHVLSGNE